MSSISTDGVRNFAGEISMMAENLSSLANKIEIYLQDIQDSIAKLHGWDGADASQILCDKPQLLDDVSTILKAPNSFVKDYFNYYKYIWSIRVINDNSNEALTVLKQLFDNIDLLNLEHNELTKMSEILDNYISSIEKQLGINYDEYGTIKDFFNGIKENAVWLEYKDTAESATILKENDLLYQKYRSKDGNDDYVDFFLDEIGNHRMKNNAETTKYGYWYCNTHPGSGMAPDSAYCAAMVSYVMEVSGNAGVILPFINVAAGANDAKKLAAGDPDNGIAPRGEWHDISDTTYQPRRGDIFYKGGDHTGVVLASDENYIYTIEGNTASDLGERGSVNTRIRVYGGDDAYITSGGFYTPDCYINYSANDENIILSEEYFAQKGAIKNGSNE